ncbi:CAP domain-containing protein [Flavobacterium noncentrifugens]|uniref:Uncharacterized conserved protein YkwD, contains CAP (CSP/antigen 5/PR1) domain n=1 Tax=Flavobacterium noncentrifugens TaxID=1128970 RepID=A0A1G9BG35_9FLAO|nr:CAP domain-containing protein [Flavobacterium noncentrifugens]SDK38407.1 Uncharacterized conserved protein YkwD, contains CAP (CSP/antigen 5/PR1) domain [Flavobacterium noncentrifugens]
MKTTLRNAILPVAMVLAFALSMVSCSSDSSEESAAQPTAVLVQNYDYSASELELADLINEYRVSIGLNALQTINHISYKSQEHNEYMIEKNALNHDLFQERSQNIIQVLGAVKVNENVAYNYVEPSSALSAWLRSPGHKANIEGDFTHFGISIRENANGKKYYTNIFIKK